MISAKSDDLDPYDIKILHELASDGRLSVTALSEKIGLSKTPCQLRLRRLIDTGYIEGFRAVLNPQMLGLDHVAFVEVKLSDTREASLEAFNISVRKIREVEECHMIAGRFDYLLKVRTANIAAYRKILGETISALPHVMSTSTAVSMQAVKETGRR